MSIRQNHNKKASEKVEQTSNKNGETHKPDLSIEHRALSEQHIIECRMLTIQQWEEKFYSHCKQLTK